MKAEMIIGNLFNIIVMALILETAVSALFSITAVREHERKLLIKTMREAITFLAAFFLCFFIPEIRILSGSAIKLAPKVDMVITALILARFAGIIKDLIARLRGE